MNRDPGVKVVARANVVIFWVNCSFLEANRITFAVISRSVYSCCVQPTVLSVNEYTPFEK